MPKDTNGRTLLDKIFFPVIGLLMLFSTVFEFWIAFSLDTELCSKHMNSPLLAGIALALSFLFNGVWGYARGMNDLLRRVAILLWTATITLGVAAAGGAIVQTEFFSDTGCDSDQNTALHYVSIIALIISVSLPHFYKSKGKHEAKGEYKKVANKEKTVDKTNAEPAVVPKSGNQLNYFYDERI